MKKFFVNIVPWLITVVALYFALRGLDWKQFWVSVQASNKCWLALAAFLTVFSYILRSYRWKFFFTSETSLNFISAFKVLLLGFFMNNILPARAGEFVRAHAGARLAKTKRTTVLASIASERLADGLTLSGFFVCCCLGLADKDTSSNLSYVAIAFAVVGVGILVVLFTRNYLFKFIDIFSERLGNLYLSLTSYLEKHRPNHEDSNSSLGDKIYSTVENGVIHRQGNASYVLNRVKIFIDGLSPLCSKKTILPISFWSIAIWSLELTVYICVTKAFNVTLSPAQCVLFMVVVNFSSLLPAAPGGVGVIEWAGTQALMSLTFFSELPNDVKYATCLGMVVSQHIIQFVVVGVLGLLSFISIRKQLGNLKDLKNEQEL